MDDTACEAQLQEASELLTAAGYHEYLPQRWAKEGCEDLFWKETAAGTPVLAFGLGAVTRFGGMLSRNTGDMELYLASSGDYEAITAEVKRENG